MGSLEDFKDELASCRALVSGSFEKLKDELASLFFDSFQSVKHEPASSQVLFLFTPIASSFILCELILQVFFLCILVRVSLISGSQRFRKNPLYPLENLLVNKFGALKILIRMWLLNHKFFFLKSGSDLYNTCI